MSYPEKKEIGTHDCNFPSSDMCDGCWNNGFNTAHSVFTQVIRERADIKKLKYEINSNVVPYTVRSENECRINVRKLAEAITKYMLEGLEP